MVICKSDYNHFPFTNEYVLAMIVVVVLATSVRKSNFTDLSLVTVHSLLNPDEVESSQEYVCTFIQQQSLCILKAIFELYKHLQQVASFKR